MVMFWRILAVVAGVAMAYLALFTLIFARWAAIINGG